MNLLTLSLGAFALSMFSSLLVWFVLLVGVIAAVKRKWRVLGAIAGILVTMLLAHTLWLVAFIGVVAFVLRRRDITSMTAGVFLGQLLAPFAGTTQGHTLFVVCLLALGVTLAQHLLGKKPVPTTA